MKKSIRIFPLAAFFFALLLAAVPCPASPPSEPPRQVRVSLLMVSMSGEKFTALLPDLLDKDKIEKAVPELLDAVKRKEITLEGYPIIVTKSGQRAFVKTTTEIFTSEGSNVPPQPPPFETATAEVPNVGVTFEVEPRISPDGRHIDLKVLPKHSELLGYEKIPGLKKSDFDYTSDDPTRQPVFFDMTTNTSLTLLSGRHMLIGVYKKAKPGGTVEIFILNAEILPVGQ